jgi:hypothetical protein
MVDPTCMSMFGTGCDKRHAAAQGFAAKIGAWLFS